ncbi:hypothetical protein H9Q10_05210 [Eikenella sp. S3360]|uniref:Uncharacterized protein n=1 Tax=Eikenella glucosivorans TaxID=2766967 RepID=A0ABS0N9V5_9NEIS|nr:hypothetical protein [Eikenella glucosivorans]MBH5329066.1 hypothetical protein [Eikenella glucosivorans]
MSKDFRVLKASLAAMITALATGVGLGVTTLLLVVLGLLTDVFEMYRDDANEAFWTGMALSMAGALIAAAVVFITVYSAYSADDEKQEGKRRVRIHRR